MAVLASLVVVGVVVAVGVAGSPSLPAWPGLGDDPQAVSIAVPTATVPTEPGTDPATASPSDPAAVPLAGLTRSDVDEPRCVGSQDCLRWRTPVARLSGEPDWVQAGWDLVLLESAGGQPAAADPDADVGPDTPDHVLRIVDVRDGQTRWRTPVQLRRDPDTGQVLLPVVAEDLVLLLDAGGELLAFDRDDGDLRWAVAGDELGWLRTAVRVEDQVLLSASRGGPQSRDNLVQAYAATDGERRWEHRGWQVAVGRDGIAVIEDSLRLVGRDATSGEERWSRFLPPGRHAVLVAGEDLLHGTLSGTTWLALADGSERQDWIAPPGAALWRDGLSEAVVLISDTQAAMFGEPGGGWTTTLPEPCCRGLQLTADEVVLATDAGGLLVLDRASGAVLGRRLAQVPEGTDAWFAGGLRFVSHGADRPVSVHDAVSGDTLAVVPGGSRPLVVRDTVVLLLADELVALQGREPAIAVPRPARVTRSGVVAD